MKKLFIVMMAVVATTMSMVSCKSKHEPKNPTKQDTTYVAREIRYQVECNEAIFKVADITLDYIGFPDSTVIKSVKLTGNWTSETYRATKGVFGMRATFEPKAGFKVTDDLFDSTNGAYIYITYGTHDVYKEADYAPGFDSNGFCQCDLRGQGANKSELTEKTIRGMSHAVAYDFYYNPTDNTLNQKSIQDFWKRH